ncbi:LppU/SCO3897 family protein [Mycobacteroides immunogenum]|uniref:Transmembrane protein n=1 Tax=Mycobacteroides immunogenum TaxID=83262 RepID=A0A7V8LKK7_9MYCO|nr:hypothetical protein [Mycobacteroides immunogenum]AMT70530.1 hypothetical protein ABG82_09560 [Mycobacteroides immunogenum]ANO03608.1 hypothetical protein BAB75_09615 [Mycobacteroides immunogenum]KIU38515.1 hypothetical protein TL11_22050 [Mycobacteroides immunogenum]KPG04275.1 hypothetical protein AN909_23695 [Mycobacteroides immunogenum]KPG04809.1 hypothetical protein AN908_23520 [Mycobacteroides immunogenum]
MTRKIQWAAIASTVVAAVWFYFWWTAPPVMGADGLEKARIPAGLIVFASAALLAWWCFAVLRITKQDINSFKNPHMIAALALASVPLLSSAFIALFVIEVLGVWMFIWVGLPCLLFSFLMALVAGPGTGSSGSKISQYLREEENNRRKKRTRIVVGACGAMVLLVGVAFVIVGVPSVGGGSDSTPSSSHYSASESDNFSDIDREFRPSTERSPLGGVGDCIALSGPAKNDVTIQKVDCSAKDATYRIFQLTRQSHECASDSDQEYAPKKTDEGDLFLCLDYNWSRDLCIFPGAATGRWHAVRDVCGPGGERPVKVLYGVANAQDCKAGGFAHPVRKFTVCTETQR